MEGLLQWETVMSDRKSVWGPTISEDRTNQLMEQNNPNGEPTGPFTGRCPHCGSKDLWDDNMAYGCNCCHALLGT